MAFKQYLVIAILFIMVYAIGYTSNTLISSASQPHCPTEDSCAYDYHNGHASIKEIVP